jgi:hypothetical protein
MRTRTHALELEWILVRTRSLLGLIAWYVKDRKTCQQWLSDVMQVVDR